ncbi:MAG TPA: heparan-alpha-glucosaminide N-acetyltransferase domain-containing protein, partial [Gemmatales bacterium]|nr:heparan-alpha-glucosaminide N-acetyltransferase domain-containing protein [Gemmatales bacterium]
WITHLCAPTFVFLAGLGAALSVLRGQSRWAGSAFLISRGFWLILLELTLVKFGWSLNWNYDFVMLQVIWAIGWSMIALGLLLWLPMPVIGLIGLAIVGGHNLTDGLASAKVLPSAPWLWDLLHNQTGMLVNRIPWVADLVPNANRRFVFNLYPVLPWFGVMLTGYGAGLIYRLDPARRRRVLILLGFTLLVGFFALRWPNLYGEPLKWRVFDDPDRSMVPVIQRTENPATLELFFHVVREAHHSL